MHIHSPIQTPTNVHARFPTRQLEKGRTIVASFGGQPTPKDQSPKPMGYDLDQPRIIYDGICNLCTTAIGILHALDRGRRFRYLPSQKLNQTIRKKYRLTESMLQGQMHLVRSDGSIVSGSIALAEICKTLCPFAFIYSLMRTSQAQRLYTWVARRRYTLFGCRKTCYAVHSTISHGADN